LRHIGWCFSLGQALRGLNAMDNLAKYLTPEDLNSMARHNNKPLAILQLNSQHLAQLKTSEQLDSFQHVQLNNTMVNFTNAMGMAERIKNTVFPATYRLFLHLFIYLFVITLSISLTDIQGYFEIPLLMVISSASSCWKGQLLTFRIRSAIDLLIRRSLQSRQRLKLTLSNC
jgi:putative membrane protein